MKTSSIYKYFFRKTRVTQMEKNLRDTYIVIITEKINP